MLQKEETDQIIRNYRLRQSRQYLAIAVTMLLLLFFVLVYKRSDIFGEISRNTICFAQIICMVAFIVFSALNWRCPACGKYLGSDINRLVCRHCRTRLR